MGHEPWSRLTTCRARTEGVDTLRCLQRLLWSTMEEIEAKAQKRTADGKRKPKDAQERRSDLLNSPKRRGSMRMKVTSQLDKKGCDCWARLKQGREGFELH